MAFANGTAALHGAAHAAGLGPGDVVATSPLSFAASANCVRYVGATPTFLDIDPATLNLDPARVPAGLDGLVAVHYAGLPMDLAALPGGADRPRVVIEDAAHALGASHPDGPVGNCAHSDLCCFSFHPVKVVTTGEGGAVTTNSDELADRLRTFRHHGIRPAPDGGRLGLRHPRAGLQLPPHRHPGRAGREPAGQARPVRRPAQPAGRPLPPAAWPTSTASSCRPPHRRGTATPTTCSPSRCPSGPASTPSCTGAASASRSTSCPPTTSAPTATWPVGPADFPATEAAYAGLLSLPLFPDLTEDDQDR